MSVNLDVKITGRFFSADMKRTVEKAVEAEVMRKVGERLERSARTRRSKGRNLVGQAKNTVTVRAGTMEVEATSTLIKPRTKGTSWVRKHQGSPGFGKGIIGSMVPHVARKTAQRITQELS
jgi:hypothetical protein